MWYVAIILIVCAGVFNALMDRSSEDRFKKPWFNKNQSWKNKWKNGDPDQGERFFLSSTVLVFLTDGWHLFQFLFHTSWQLSVALVTDCPLITFVVAKALFSLTFELLYRNIK